MRINHRTTLILTAMSLLVLPLVAYGDDNDGPAREFRANLQGRNEVPLTLSAARGRLALTVNATDTSVHFVLQYMGLQTMVTASHIHVAQPNVNGGVAVFFCGGGGRPACPQGQGTVEGDFTAADVLALPTQQLEVNNLAKLLAAIRAGKTYANLHTQTSPAGEIRGQIMPEERRRFGPGDDEQ